MVGINALSKSGRPGFTPGTSKSPFRRSQKPFGFKQPNQQHSLSQQKLAGPLVSQSQAALNPSFISQMSSSQNNQALTSSQTFVSNSTTGFTLTTEADDTCSQKEQP